LNVIAFGIFGSDSAQNSDNLVHLPASLNLSTFLEFMKTNLFQHAVGSQKGINISQAAACRVINQVAKLLSSEKEQFIRFPTAPESHELAGEIC
jgi:hypothetical protein